MPIVGIERAFNDPAVGLRCIDHCPLAAAYCNVTVINDYISAFDVVDIVVTLIAGAAAPHVTRHVALRNACLVDAPVYKTGAVKTRSALFRRERSDNRVCSAQCG